MKKRIIYVDYLKFFGLLLVILAHVECPSLVMQIRGFDVPLLVVLSGYLASKTFKSGDDKKYYLKRIKRLVIPSWLFLVIFFTIQFIAYSKPTFENIIKAIAFQRDAYMVGMLWVIWVYLVCALTVPYIHKIGFTKKNNIIIILIFILYELVCMNTNISENRIIYNTLLTIIPWGAITYLGYNFDQISKKQKKILTFVLIFVFVIYAILLKIKTGFFVLTNDYKYPARIYYFSYAIPIILVLVGIFQKLPLKNNRLITFVSSSSLWIYLWHILILYVVKSIVTNDALWMFQYILIILISTTITIIQNIVVKKIIKKYKLDFLDVFLG